jgi:hypothetical protein
MLGGKRRQVNDCRGVGGILRGLLAQNLSALSTSAPAPSTRVDPNVSRRGTCDRGIWTKPLAFAADAEGYINIMVWGFNGRFAISSPSGHSNCQFC